MPRSYSQALSVEDARALNLALTYPQAVGRLLLCDTGAGSENAAAFKTRGEEYAQAADQGLESLFDAVVSTWPVFSDYGNQGDAQQKRLRDLVMSQHAHGMALTARHALATRKPVYALEPGMRKLRMPTLVAYGTRDGACVQSSEFMAATIPGAQIWRVPNPTHFINLDEPDLFNQKLLDFLAS